VPHAYAENLAGAASRSIKKFDYRFIVYSDDFRLPRSNDDWFFRRVIEVKAVQAGLGRIKARRHFIYQAAQKTKLEEATEPPTNIGARHLPTRKTGGYTVGATWRQLVM